MEIFLTDKDLRKLQKIGQGTDGTVYKYQNNILIKIYHHKMQEILKVYDNDIKIYEKGNIKYHNPYENKLNYYTYSESNDAPLSRD